MSGILVRNLILSDAEQAAQVHVQTFQDSYQGLLPSEQLATMSNENMVPRWKELISINKAGLILLGAFEGDKLLAIAGAGQPREARGYDAEMWSMNVPKIHQKRGLGRELFCEAVERLLAEGHRSMYLFCIDKNMNALGFYQKMGGKVTDIRAERKGYIELLVSWECLPGT
jgi:ribosomal protein S18 acetylase RimI-like enzyme